MDGNPPSSTTAECSVQCAMCNDKCWVPCRRHQLPQARVLCQDVLKNIDGYHSRGDLTKRTFINAPHPSAVVSTSRQLQPQLVLVHPCRV